MVNLSTKLVKSNFKITQMQDQNTIIDFLLEELKGVDLKSLKLDPDFIRYVSEVIENDVMKRTTEKPYEKVNKLELFVSVLKKLHSEINSEDLELAKGILEFLLKNKLVKKTKLSKIVLFYLKKKFSLCSE
jgi:hypothetical protein